ncbi:MAG: hypothetical protein PHE33_10075 [Bacteroidales bacterium]|nr:hypothetical protein [Bacteroidales bacterium]
MKKLKDFSKHEKLLIVMLILSIILVVFSWDRISEKAGKVLNLYTTGTIEETE